MNEELLGWLTGRLGPHERIWSALAPGLLIAGYFLVGLAAFCVRCLLRGVPRDQEVEARGKTILVGFFLRHYFFWVIDPIWRFVCWTAVPATALTTLSMLLGLAAGVAAAMGRFALAGWLFLFAGILDTLDGRVARARRESSPRGAAIDSVLDRYTDSALLVGLAWYYRDSWVLLFALLALVGGSLVPYVRARGEGLGVAVRGGTMQRLERVLVLGVTVALSPVHAALFEPSALHPMHWPAVVGLVFVGVGSNITAVSRLLALLRLLAPNGPVRERPASMQLGLHAFAGALATALDYLVVLALVELVGQGAAWATALGAAAGAVCNFAFNRAVTFRSTGMALPEAGRYALVSGVSLLLNSGGMAVMLLLPLVDYRWCWWLVRATVWILWNYPLQRDYVFAPVPALVVEERHAR